MSWWKRLLFSVVSLIFGFCSLDYLFYAFRLLINAGNTTGQYNPENDAWKQLAGTGLFVLWFLLLAIYVYIIRRHSSKIDMIETDKKSGRDKIRRRWFDILLQAGILVTGMFFRWCYLLFIYLPKQ